MYRTLRFLAAMVLACLAILTREAAGTTITTTTLNSWKATLTGSQTELNLTAIQSTSYNTSSGITLSAVGNSSIDFVFTGPDNGSYKLTGNANNGTLTGASDGTGYINAATPSGGETAILLGIGCTGTCAGSTPLTLLLSDGESFSISSGLFGLSISHPITWAQLSTTSSSAAVLTDFWYGTSDLAPDPPQTVEGATAILIGGGLLVIFGWRRKWVKQSPPPEYSPELVMDA